jgi:hypothetical protein
MKGVKGMKAMKGWQKVQVFFAWAFLRAQYFRIPALIRFRAAADIVRRVRPAARRAPA